MQIMTQLAFRGQCRQVFEHYEKVLGGSITVMNTFGGNDAKLPPGSTAAAPDQTRFAELKVGDFAILGNDVPENEYAPMRGFHIALHERPVTRPGASSMRFQRGVKLRRHSARSHGHPRLVSSPTISEHLG